MSTSNALDIREVVSQLTDLWLELLPVDEVMQDDDFFNLDGDSVLALQLTNRIRDLFQVELQITDVFTTPRVPGLAASILEKHQRPAQVARLAPTVEKGSLAVLSSLAGRLDRPLIAR